jgi:NADPH:quinone reductase-like Zn-dependent oxidoreductase
VGDEVFADAAKGQGSFAEYVNVEETQLCLKPANIRSVGRSVGG